MQPTWSINGDSATLLQPSTDNFSLSSISSSSISSLTGEHRGEYTLSTEETGDGADGSLIGLGHRANEVSESDVGLNPPEEDGLPHNAEVSFFISSAQWWIPSLRFMICKYPTIANITWRCIKNCNEKKNENMKYEKKLKRILKQRSGEYNIFISELFKKGSPRFYN